ncbi:MAG: hypothetical protein JKY54_14930 [Flavobacteriales bacterium]|nr:hypothetical protein [Flavobacteriales bacterium]
MKNQIFKLIIISCLLISNKFYAQTGNVGIGTYTPDSSAKLDISATDKGILLPRVTLTGLNDATTIAGPAASLLIWNTGDTWGDAAYYYNNGTTATPIWAKMSLVVAQSTTFIKNGGFATPSFDGEWYMYYNTSTDQSYIKSAVARTITASALYLRSSGANVATRNITMAANTWYTIWSDNTLNYSSFGDFEILELTDDLGRQYKFKASYGAGDVGMFEMQRIK